MTTDAKNYINNGFRLDDAPGLAYELRQRVEGKLSTRVPAEDIAALLIQEDSDKPFDTFLPYLKRDMIKSPNPNFEDSKSDKTTSRLEILADGEILGTLTLVKGRDSLLPLKYVSPLEVTYTGTIPGYQDPQTGEAEVVLHEQRRYGMFTGQRTDKHTAVALSFMDLMAKFFGGVIHSKMDSQTPVIDWDRLGQELFITRLKRDITPLKEVDPFEKSRQPIEGTYHRGADGMGEFFPQPQDFYLCRYEMIPRPENFFLKLKEILKIYIPKDEKNINVRKPVDPKDEL